MPFLGGRCIADVVDGEVMTFLYDVLSFADYAVCRRPYNARFCRGLVWHMLFVFLMAAWGVSCCAAGHRSRSRSGRHLP